LKMEYFGDSYDIVKQSLLHWLRSFGDWAVHPMFTEEVSDQDNVKFSYFLGVDIISKDILTKDSDRDAYFKVAIDCEKNIFLDPNTGVKYNNNNSDKTSYIMFEELVKIVSKRPCLLTLVFDQSLARGREREQLQLKLDSLFSNNIYGIAYVSHAGFMLLSCDKKLIEMAYDKLIRESRLPVNRFILRNAA